MGVTIYAGTGRGVIAIAEQNGDWSIGRRRFMPEWEITQLVTRANGQIIASTRGDGVWLQLDKKGQGMSGGWAKPCYGRPGPGKTHSLAVDLDDPDTIYAGTEPMGFWVTHDAGKNWEMLPGLWNTPGVQEMTYPVSFVEPHVRHIAIDPSNPDIFYASLQVGYVAKSTNRGVTWRVIDGGIDADVHTIIVHPKNPKKLFAATGGHGSREGKTKGKALYTSDDAGETWTPMGLEFAEEYSLPLAMHPGNPDVMFSGLATGYPPLWRRPSGAEARFISSRDGGKTWQQVALPDAEVGQAFPGSIAFDPGDPDHVYMATDKGGLYHSGDSGKNWQRVPVDIAKAGGLTEVGFADMRIFHS